jgi:hypothetical protein
MYSRTSNHTPNLSVLLAMSVPMGITMPVVVVAQEKVLVYAVNGKCRRANA